MLWAVVRILLWRMGSCAHSAQVEAAPPRVDLVSMLHVSGRCLNAAPHNSATRALGRTELC